MSYEECPRHEIDATNGCPECVVDDGELVDRCPVVSQDGGRCSRPKGHTILGESWITWHTAVDDYGVATRVFLTNPDGGEWAYVYDLDRGFMFEETGTPSPRPDQRRCTSTIEHDGETLRCEYEQGHHGAHAAQYRGGPMVSWQTVRQCDATHRSGIACLREPHDDDQHRGITDDGYDFEWRDARPDHVVMRGDFDVPHSSKERHVEMRVTPGERVTVPDRSHTKTASLVAREITLDAAVAEACNTADRAVEEAIDERLPTDVDFDVDFDAGGERCAEVTVWAVEPATRDNAADVEALIRRFADDLRALLGGDA